MNCSGKGCGSKQGFNTNAAEALDKFRASSFFKGTRNAGDSIKQFKNLFSAGNNSVKGMNMPDLSNIAKIGDLSKNISRSTSHDKSVA
jgi:hypothetical protein